MSSVRLSLVSVGRVAVGRNCQLISGESIFISLHFHCFLVYLRLLFWLNTNTVCRSYCGACIYVVTTLFDKSPLVYHCDVTIIWESLWLHFVGMYVTLSCSLVISTSLSRGYRFHYMSKSLSSMRGQGVRSWPVSKYENCQVRVGISYKRFYTWHLNRRFGWRVANGVPN